MVSGEVSGEDTVEVDVKSKSKSKKAGRETAKTKKKTEKNSIAEPVAQPVVESVVESVSQPRFTCFTIKHYDARGVLIITYPPNSRRILFSDLTDEEKKWLHLFKKGIHKEEENEENDDEMTLEDFSHHLTDFEQNEENKQEDVQTESAVSLLDRFSSLNSDTSSISSPATDMISVKKFLLCLEEQGTPPELIDTIVDCILTYEEDLYLGEKISLTNDVNRKLNDLKTPVKAEKKEMTEEQKQKKLQDLNRKVVERCGEMGIDVKKIPIGTLMEGLRLEYQNHRGRDVDSGPLKQKDIFSYRHSF